MERRGGLVGRLGTAVRRRRDQDTEPAGRRRSVRRPLLLVLLIVVVALLAVGGRRSSITSVVEVLAVIAILIGMAVALGVFEGDRRGRGRAASHPAPPAPLPTAAAAQACLDGLDRIEHRRIELGEPWPQVVIGPTGVVLVEVCGLANASIPDADPLRPPREPVPTDARCGRCGAARGSIARLREVVAGIPEAAGVPVRSVVLVAPGAADGCGAGQDEVAVRAADRLADELARGPVLPMATVDAVFAGLARQLTTSPGSLGPVR
jgi:hypothetical protein